MPNRHGQLAFHAQVTGQARNQGIFVADGSGLRVIAMGCGNIGGTGTQGAGCGDPTPIGGTFAGMFGSPALSPVINDAGDVLFISDVYQGTSSRGLFLYRSSTSQIVKIAAVGDPSPIGGSFQSIGYGALNNAGDVVFLAGRMVNSAGNTDIMLWHNGTVSKVAAVGDPAPGGGSFSNLGRYLFGFSDGTYVAHGPPGFNDAGQMAFLAVSDPGNIFGIIFSSGGNHQWWARKGEPTPAGGTYTAFEAPLLNNHGQIAFGADFHPTSNTSSFGWFTGRPGEWRKALSFHDPVDGGEVYGLAVSAPPVDPFDDDGNLLLWCEIRPFGGDERLVMRTPDGELLLIARQGDPSPVGGTIQEILPWPSMSGCQGTMSIRYTPAPADAHFVFDRAAREVTGLTFWPRSPSDLFLELGWDDQSTSVCAATRYDVARGSISLLHTIGQPADAVCVAEQIHSTTYSEPMASCHGTSDGCWYLARSGNVCGRSSYGSPYLDLVSPCP